METTNVNLEEKRFKTSLAARSSSFTVDGLWK